MCYAFRYLYNLSLISNNAAKMGGPRLRLRGGGKQGACAPDLVQIAPRRAEHLSARYRYLHRIHSHERSFPACECAQGLDSLACAQGVISKDIPSIIHFLEKQKRSLTAGSMSALPVFTEIWRHQDGNARPVRRPAIVGLANQRVRIDVFHVS